MPWWNDTNDDNERYDEVRDFLGTDECPGCGNFVAECECDRDKWWK